MKNIIIASDENTTYIFVDGAVYASHITEVKFHHKSSCPPEMEIVADTLPIPSDISNEKFREWLNILMKLKPPHNEAAKD